jgi:c-di-GMP-related signal transduction protein
LVGKFNKGKVKHFSVFIRELLAKLDKACGFSQDRRINNSLCELYAFSRVLSRLVTESNAQIEESELPNLKNIANNLARKNEIVKNRNIKQVNDFLCMAENEWGIKDYQVKIDDEAIKVKKQVACLAKTLPLFQFVDIYGFGGKFEKNQIESMSDYIKLKDKELTI